MARVLRTKLAVLLLAGCSMSPAASRFWVGGTATWDGVTIANWSATSGGASGASVPTAADDVFLDAASGAVIVTLSSSSTGRSLDCTGFTGTLSHPAAITFTLGDATAGASSNALIFGNSGTMTYTLGNVTTSAVTFASTSATQQNVNFAGQTAGNVTFSGVGSSYLLTGALNSGSTALLLHSAGTLNLNGQTLAIGKFSTAGSTRTLTMGAANVTVSGTGTPWSVTNASLTFSGASSTITCTAGGGGVVFSGGAFTYGTVTMSGANGFVSSGSTVVGTLNFTGGGASMTIQNGITLTNLTVTGTAAATDTLSTSIMTVTGALTLNGNSASNRLLVQSSTAGTQRTYTITGATVTGSNVDFMDIKLSVNTDLSAITGGSGDCGGNSGVTFTTAVPQFWVGNGGSWTNAASHWSTSTGGAANGRMPLCQDNVTFDANSFSSAGQTVTMSIPRVGNNLSFAAVTNNPTIDFTVQYDLFGSLTLAAGMTWIPEQATDFRCRTSCTVTSAGQKFDQTHGWNFIMPGGTLTLQDDLDASQTGGTPHWGSFVLSSGTVDLNNHNLTCSSISTLTTGATTLIMGSGTITIKDGNTAPNSTFNITAATTITANTSSVVVQSPVFAGTFTFALTGHTFNNFSFGTPSVAAIYRVTGSNTFNAVTLQPGVSMQFTSGTTQTVSSLSCTGTQALPITWQAVTSGTAATISKSTGTVTCDWMSLKDSRATGGASFYAGANTINVSGNSGWIFAPVFSGKFSISGKILITGK